MSILSGFTILLSIWVSIVLPRSVVRPIYRLKEAVDRAVRGDYRLEVTVRGDDELEQLADSVEKLITRVRQRI